MISSYQPSTIAVNMNVSDGDTAVDETIPSNLGRKGYRIYDIPCGQKYYRRHQNGKWRLPATWRDRSAWQQCQVGMVSEEGHYGGGVDSGQHFTVQWGLIKDMYPRITRHIGYHHPQRQP